MMTAYLSGRESDDIDKPTCFEYGGVDEDLGRHYHFQ
jgi:hypothetical protein